MNLQCNPIPSVHNDVEIEFVNGFLGGGNFIFQDLMWLFSSFDGKGRMHENRMFVDWLE